MGMKPDPERLAAPVIFEGLHVGGPHHGLPADRYRRGNVSMCRTLGSVEFPAEMTFHLDHQGRNGRYEYNGGMWFWDTIEVHRERFLDRIARLRFENP